MHSISASYNQLPVGTSTAEEIPIAQLNRNLRNDPKNVQNLEENAQDNAINKQIAQLDEKLAQFKHHSREE